MLPYCSGGFRGVHLKKTLSKSSILFRKLEYPDKTLEKKIYCEFPEVTRERSVVGKLKRKLRYPKNVVVLAAFNSIGFFRLILFVS